MGTDPPASPLHCPYCGETLIFLRTEIAGDFPEHRYICFAHGEFGVSRESFRSIQQETDSVVRPKPDRRRLPRVD